MSVCTVGPGKQYATLALAEAANFGLASSTLSEPLDVECYPFEDAPTTISGFTATATNKITVKTPTSNSNGGKWDLNVYRIKTTSGPALTLAVPHTSIDGIQIDMASATNADAIAFSGTWAPYYVRRCIARKTGTASGGSGMFLYGVAGVDLSVEFCVLYGFPTGLGVYQSTSILRIRNCTVVDCTTGVTNWGSGSINATNVIVSGGTTCYSGGMTCSHCWSSDGTVPASDANRIINTAPVYADAASRDYHIALENARLGTDPGSNSDYDIDRQAITTTWYRGADAVPGPAISSLTVPVIGQSASSGDANPVVGVTLPLHGQLSEAADANPACGTVLPAMGETAASCDVAPTLGTNLPAIAQGVASTDISATCGTVAAMVATGTVTGDITPPEPEEMPYIPPWRMAKVPFSGSRIAAVPATSRVAAVPAASRVSAVPAASRVAAVPFASRVAPARIE